MLIINGLNLKTYVKARSFLLLVMLVFPLAVYAQTESSLQQFEKNATQPNQESRSSSPEDTYSKKDKGRSDDENDLSDDLEQEIVELVVEMVTLPGVYSWERVTPPPDKVQNNDEQATPRYAGDGPIPFARIDASYNRIDSRIFSLSTRGEIGFGPFGFEARNARYSEIDPQASLDITQYHYLYRMSLGDYLELDFGMGKYELSGLTRTSGPSSTLHLLIYPSDQLGIELRPSWATLNGNSIGDHEVAVNYGSRYWAIRAGYHWLTAPSSSLDGPFIGFSLRL